MNNEDISQIEKAQNNNKNPSQQQKSLGLFSSLKQEHEDESDALLGNQRSNQGLNEQEMLQAQEELRRSLIVKRNENNPLIKRNRMNGFETYFAIVKGYTTLNIFMIPIGFKDGGWLFSPIPLVIMCTIETACAIKLVQAAKMVSIYSYPDLVEYSLGYTFRAIFQIVIAFLSFVFSFNSLAFFTKTLRNVIQVIFDVDGSIWIFATVTILILAPLAWIRTIETFKIGFIYSGIAILTMVIVLVCFVSIMIKDHDNDAGPGWQAFNGDEYWTMLSISFVMFEGIPSVLPVLEASDSRDNFGYLLIGALATLCTIDIVFAELCYYTFGDDLKEPLVMWQLPEDNWVLIIAKLLLCGMILIAYPLIIYVTNQVIEFNIFKRMEYSETRKWLKNLSRTIVVIIATIIAVTCYYELHKIIGFFGVILGGFIVMVVPSLIHNDLVAKSSGERCCNYILIVYAILSATIVVIALAVKEYQKKERE